MAQTRTLHTPDKKIIKFDWATPTPKYLEANIADMQDMPFDGMALAPGCQIASMLDPTPWGRDPRFVDLETLSHIQWGRFQHNVMLCIPTHAARMSWFNDEQWATILDNMHVLARAAKLAKCDGIVFDPEWMDGGRPWLYEAISEGHARAEVEAKVRQRARQIIEAWQDEYPDIKVFCQMMFTYMPRHWEMVPSFYNGFYDGLRPQALIVDLFAESYYYANTDKFFRTHLVGEQYIAHENLDKWRTQTQICRSAYADICYDLYQWEGFKWEASMADKDRRWEHHVYNELATTDEYIRYYSDKMAFRMRSARWNEACEPTGTDISHLKSGPTPISAPLPGVVAGIGSAVRKYRDGERLGFDIVGPDMARSDFAFDSSVVVNIVSPSHRSSRRAPADLAIEASATGGDVEKVVFYANLGVVGEASASPYRCELKGLPVGSYTFFARAFTRDGKHGTSGPVVVTVTGAPK